MPAASSRSARASTSPTRRARLRASSRAPAGASRIACRTPSRTASAARFCALKHRRATIQPSPARATRAGGDAQEGGELELRRAHREAGCQHELAARAATRRARRNGSAGASSRGSTATRSRRHSRASAQSGAPIPTARAAAVACRRRAARQVRTMGIGFHACPRQVRDGRRRHGAAAPDGQERIGLRAAGGKCARARATTRRQSACVIHVLAPVWKRSRFLGEGAADLVACADGPVHRATSTSGSTAGATRAARGAEQISAGQRWATLAASGLCRRIAREHPPACAGAPDGAAVHPRRGRDSTGSP